MLGGCPRSSYYKIKNVPQTTPPDVNAQLNFEVGNLWEQKIAEMLDTLGILIDWWNEGQSERNSVDKTKWKGTIRKDKWIDEELGCAGTPDIRYKQNTKNVLADVKTMKDDAVKYIVKQSDEEYFQTHPQYRLQLGTYLVLNKRRVAQGLETISCDYGKLIIISKDNGAIIKEPCLFLTPELEKEVLQEIAKLRAYLIKDELPPCTCEGWQINYCNYGDVDSIQPNSKKKLVPTKCCSEHLVDAVKLKKNN
jgi:hypothetical protein